jgi:hypothetical protein
VEKPNHGEVTRLILSCRRENAPVMQIKKNPVIQQTLSGHWEISASSNSYFFKTAGSEKVNCQCG